ncbi:unannotated protein [freshwater metagenome]|uniref:Unannotated protein n=1 Tax=freshwater metagenome TaxID=449393 RepID=A0A6J6F9H1_9ZZZZ
MSTGSVVATKAAEDGPNRRTPRKKAILASTVLMAASPTAEPYPPRLVGACIGHETAAATTAKASDPVRLHAEATSPSPPSVTSRSL